MTVSHSSDQISQMDIRDVNLLLYHTPKVICWIDAGSLSRSLVYREVIKRMEMVNNLQTVAPGLTDWIYAFMLFTLNSDLWL